MHLAPDVPPDRGIIKVIVLDACREPQEEAQSDDRAILLRQPHCLLVLEDDLNPLEAVVHRVPDDLSLV
jgi:hypothetical protein